MTRRVRSSFSGSAPQSARRRAFGRTGGPLRWVAPPALGAALFAALAAALALAQSPKASPPAARRASYALGVGVGAPLDYEQDFTFADAIKVARVIEPAAGVASDQDGWLRGDGSILVWTSGPKNNSAGSYKLKYDGRAQVSIELASGQISEETYDPATNTSTREVKLKTDQETFKLRFEKTSAGVRNVKLMRPLYRGATSAHSFDELWYRPMKQIHQRFQWIRTMDFTATNGQDVVSWADRTLPSRWSQQNPVEGGGAWQGRGGAWEYTVHMANEEQKDLWISVPLLADDDYVRKLAKLIHYGSDGKNPYPSQQAKPVWAPLDERLKLYVEYSNEIWNFGFPQWTQLLERSRREVKAGNTNLNFDGSDYDGAWNNRYWARRLLQISAIFRAEFGDAAMMTRIRPLFETQLSWPENYLWHGLWFLDAWYNNGDGVQHVPDPHPVNYYLWGAGGSTYPVGFPDPLAESKKLTVAQIFNGYRSMLPAWSEHQKREVDYVRAFGLKRISYEGGPGLDSRGGEEYASADKAKFAAQKDPRIKQVYVDMLKRYAELGGDGFTNFLTANPSHGVVSVYDGPNALKSPKCKALDQVLKGPMPQPTWGVALPATIVAGRYRVSSNSGPAGDKDEPTPFDAKTWLGYTVRSAAKARYALRVHAGSADANGKLNVWLDGNLAGTLAIPQTGAPTDFAVSAPLTLELEPGQHGIRLDGASGSFALKQLELQRAM